MTPISLIMHKNISFDNDLLGHTKFIMFKRSLEYEIKWQEDSLNNLYEQNVCSLAHWISL